eukprot:COSAG01_NODE_4924_length_4617_cov_3.416335_4_plen_74_part_00
MTFGADDGTPPAQGQQRQGGQGRTYRYLRSQKEDAHFSFGWGLSYGQFRHHHLRHIMILIGTLDWLSFAYVLR